MSNEADHMDAPEEHDADSDNAVAKPRMRFQGIVEAGTREAVEVAGALGILTVPQNDKRWNAMSRQVWLYSRLTAIFVFFSFVVGMPLGNYFAHLQIFGSVDGWNPLAAYDLYLLLFAFIVPVLVLLAGYILSRTLTMMNAAESIAAVAQQFVTPDVTAARNADIVADVVQGHVTALNEGLDGALSRLASVESMIRQHVEAIEIAGEAIEQKATGAVERVADERSRLMDLTESLNAHADSFAAAIAEKAKTSIVALEKAETISSRVEEEFDERLSRLEGAAARALSSFETLRDALRDSDGAVRASADSISAAAKDTLKATEQAKAASNAAAESAAMNAANVATAASRASQTAIEAADAAIETAAEQAKRMGREAVEAAAMEGEKVQQATAKVLSDVSKSTSAAIDAAAIDAAKATKAAADISEAARVTSEAAKKASDEVAAASQQARKASQETLQFTKVEQTQIVERKKALSQARAALEKENTRLETLIEEQRNRADRLAEAISSQTERLSRLAETQLKEQEAAEEESERQAFAEEDAKKAAALEADKAKKAAVLEAEQKAQAEAAAKLEKETAAQKRKQDQQEKAQQTESAREDKAAAKTNGAARLEEIARDIADRRPRKGRQRSEPVLSLATNNDGKSGKRSKSDVSWREILDAADDAEPLELGEVTRNKESTAETPRDEAENAIKIISDLQHFTYDLETRLYGAPCPAGTI
ncbi:MAG: hypothetical protein GXP04_08325 [Alphaproteobacteria bacterium]|nr:hypothetical protein [Alphaproteobacteria bacterium]